MTTQPPASKPSAPVAAPQSPAKPKASLPGALTVAYEALAPLDFLEQRRVLGALCQLLGIDVDFLADGDEDEDEPA